MQMNPQLLLALTISTYWCCVVVMSIRSWVKYRVPSGSLPKTSLEKRMWVIWLPTIVAWIVLSWNSVDRSASAGMSNALEWIFALAAVFAFFLTVSCWIKMGQNWSMAVRPDKQTELITDGMFSNVRHPIYALSLGLMICSVFVLQSWGIAIVAILHCSLLILKSANEEKYLTRIHGQQYLEYLQQTNRFFPVKALAIRS